MQVVVQSVSPTWSLTVLIYHPVNNVFVPSTADTLTYIALLSHSVNKLSGSPALQPGTGYTRHFRSFMTQKVLRNC